jgi:peptidoglycan/xylan/chitin deacetylase (PgdA/CDA1 family)
VVTPPVDAANLIPNASLETSATGTTPDSWQNFGANPSTFTYLNTGHTGGKSVQVQITSLPNTPVAGGSDWYYADVPVTAGQSYKYSNWYMSDVATEVDAEVIVNGVAQYFNLGSVAASSTWSQVSVTFTAPAGATSIAIYQTLASVGTLTTDDYSLTPYTPTPFTRGIVSVTFDDNWANQYANAYPYMKGLGLPATYYVISGSLGTSDYMTSANVVDLFQNGNEIGSHTVHHCDLTGQQTDDPTNCPLTITTAQVQSELADSKTALEALLGGTPVTDFAYPYGAYNATTISMAQADGYLSQRDVTAGLNTKDGLDVTKLKMFEVDSNITVAQVEAWIDQAAAEHAWLILTYHEVATTPSDPSDALYTTQPADFQAEMTYLKNSGIAVQTVKQALAEVQAQ